MCERVCMRRYVFEGTCERGGYVREGICERINVREYVVEDMRERVYARTHV